MRVRIANDMSRRAVDITSGIVVGIVLVVGGIIIVAAAVKHGSHLLDDPTKPRTVTTTVVRITGPGKRPVGKRTTTVTKAPATRGKRAKTTTTVVTEHGGRTREVTKTTEDADDSVFERSLSGAGFLLFRFALLFVAAFLAGAVVQRTLLANFAFKVGPVEVPGLPAAADASKTAITTLTDSVNKQTVRLRRMSTRLNANTAATDDLATLVHDAAEALTQLERRVDQIETRIP
jgi:hypothetical protein